MNYTDALDILKAKYPNTKWGYCYVRKNDFAFKMKVKKNPDDIFSFVSSYYVVDKNGNIKAEPIFFSEEPILETIEL